MPIGIGDEGGALMLKVDAHQHFWSYRADEHPWMAGDAMTPLRRDFLPADLQPLLQRQGVAATVAVQATRVCVATCCWPCSTSMLAGTSSRASVSSQ